MRAEKILKELEEVGLDIETQVVYVGPVFTIVTATVRTKFQGTPEQVIVMIGEGIARKLFRDKGEAQIGINIATSRALNAIWKKYSFSFLNMIHGR